MLRHELVELFLVLGVAQAIEEVPEFDLLFFQTLKRLEEEQVEFREFLDRLRHAKDKEEFDQFMAQHRPRPAPPSDGQPQA